MIDNWNYLRSHSHFPSSSSSSSGGSSHLSILTSPSSISSSLSEVRPQSPTPSPSPSVSSGKKTNAFFASPFSNSAELQPPPPLTRSSSVASSSSQPSRAEDDHMDTTPRISSAAPPKSAGSLNDSFFHTSSESQPVPPPSLRLFTQGSAPTSPETSPPSSPRSAGKSRLPPLSRIFPSRVRYTEVDGLPSRECSLRAQSPLPASPAPRRQFVELDDVVTSPESMTMPLPEPKQKPKPKELTVLVPPPSSAVPSSLPTPVSVAQPTAPPAGPTPVLHVGDIITETPSDSAEDRNVLKLELVRMLGTGAFSSVWLAQDVSGRIGSLEVVRKSSLRRSMSKSSRGSLKRKKTQGSLRRKVEGAVPKVHLEDWDSLGDGERLGSADSLHGFFKEREERLGRGRVDEESQKRPEGGRLVALKMTDRSLCDRDDRTRVSFVREVEVLKHISHPSIVSYIHAFSTPAFHVLVLEQLSGGELFDLVSNQDLHARLGEPLLRRIFGELCRAVSWMHAVGLVHRDIKLENILLTRPVFSDPSSPAALIKLTDFGLSRFIDPSSPLLTTRCGSESYAAPELVTGRPYDGRDTDAWACGVVLYALATRRLPFDSPDRGQEENMRHEERNPLPGEPKRVRGPRRDERTERKALLMRIAKGEYSWPDLPEATDAGPLRGIDLARSDGVRRVVGRLLVRDPRKRTRLAQLWDDEWVRGEGAPPAPSLPDSLPAEEAVNAAVPDDAGAESDATAPEAWDTIDPEDVDTLEDAVEEGVLVDEQDIGPDSVARQEH